jgi:hypothetical protein
MTRSIAIALVLAASAIGNAFADDITIESKPFVSTASRAEVAAELAAFRASGVNPWADSYNQLAGFTSSKSRDEVKAEFLASREEVAALNGEDSGSVYLARRSEDSDAVRMAGGMQAAE